MHLSLNRGGLQLAQSDWRRFLETFSHIARKTELCPNNQQQLTGALGQILAQTPPDAPVPMQPLYEWLQAGSFDEEILKETFCAFMDRSGDLGVEVTPPDAVAALPPNERDMFLARYMTRQTIDFTPVKIEAEAPTKEAKAPLSAAPKKSYAKKEEKSRLPLLIGVGLVLVCGLIGATFIGAPPPNTDVKITNPKGLPCKKLGGTAPSLICFVDDNEYKAEQSAESLREKALLTLTDAGVGFKRVSVYTISGKLIGAVTR